MSRFRRTPSPWLDCAAGEMKGVGIYLLRGLDLFALVRGLSVHPLQVKPQWLELASYEGNDLGAGEIADLRRLGFVSSNQESRFA